MLGSPTPVTIWWKPGTNSLTVHTVQYTYMSMFTHLFSFLSTLAILFLMVHMGDTIQRPGWHIRHTCAHFEEMVRYTCQYGVKLYQIKKETSVSDMQACIHMREIFGSFAKATRIHHVVEHASRFAKEFMKWVKWWKFHPRHNFVLMETPKRHNHDKSILFTFVASIISGAHETQSEA